jgi:hypothetical protein
MRIAILGSVGVGGYFGAPTSTTRAHSSRCHVTTADAPPAGASQAHRHPGFVLGDVLEGEIRLEWIAASRPSIAPTRCSTSRQACSTLSANASPVNPARFLAIVVAQKGAPITVTR